MINTDIYNYVNILDKAADASSFRNELISNNIANVDTPNYKRKDLNFENILQAELGGEKNLWTAVKNANMDLETLDPQVYTDTRRGLCMKARREDAPSPYYLTRCILLLRGHARAARRAQQGHPSIPGGALRCSRHSTL